MQKEAPLVKLLHEQSEENPGRSSPTVYQPEAVTWGPLFAISLLVGHEKMEPLELSRSQLITKSPLCE